MSEPATVDTAPESILLVRNNAKGRVRACAEGVSFWGGVDPDTGVIIDAHHPDHGTSLAGRIVLMPTSRGSCSGSGVLLHLARNSLAPAALVFCERENTLTLGAIIAARLFNRPVAVVRLPRPLYQDLSKSETAEIRDCTLLYNGQSIALSQADANTLKLDETDKRMLEGQDGAAARLAMEVLCVMAAAQRAQELTSVSRGHIDGCILAHDANLDFAEKMLQMGARVRIPTTINAISVDRENWQSQGVKADFGQKASRLADAYVKMGARPTFTCAPYLLDDRPVGDEAIGWSESNAVIYANSVLGARTEKHPDYLDLFIAMTGRVPLTGVYLSRNRAPACELRVQAPADVDDSFWPMLGWLAGSRSPEKIPLLTGLETLTPAVDDLKALCAAFGATSAAPMLHVRGHTPEGDLALLPDSDKLDITIKDFTALWLSFNAADDKVDLIAIGSPHASLSECRKFADLLADQHCHPGTDAIVTVGRNLLHDAGSSNVFDRLRHVGVRVIPDLCWCSITEPLFPENSSVLMTNSGKYAHYANGLTGRSVRFGSLKDCANAAITGRAQHAPPDWLKLS